MFERLPNDWGPNMEREKGMRFAATRGVSQVDGLSIYYMKSPSRNRWYRLYVNSKVVLRNQRGLIVVMDSRG